MSKHHLILGETTDYITGEKIVETLDENYRQKIAKFLVETKGYDKKDILVKRKINITLDENKTGKSTVDFSIIIENKTFVIVIFGPGSLTTRQRSTIAAARLIESYEVPYSIITNGVDAEIMLTESGKVISKGFDKIPEKKDALKIFKEISFRTLPPDRIEKEKRILYVFDILTKKECEDFICCNSECY